VNSKVENSSDFCLDFVQEFGLRKQSSDEALKNDGIGLKRALGKFRKQYTRRTVMD
jgi:hypothetical protein